ncbi:MAG: hypothetical protein H7Y01_15125 [Ferruginibacter sp.]|nr:hypothetical protein [Chitinophagaceae bacterium]
MIIIYIGLIALAAFPLALTIWRMQAAAKIKKNGVQTNGVIKHINRIRMVRGGSMDILTIEYKDGATGQPYKAKATVSPGKYQIDDTMAIVYLPGKPSKYAIDTKKAYWAILIFCIILLLFVLFAIYKIDEMVKTGQM